MKLKRKLKLVYEEKERKKKEDKTFPAHQKKIPFVYFLALALSLVAAFKFNVRHCRPTNDNILIFSVFFFVSFLLESSS